MLTGGVDTKGKAKEGVRDPLEVEMERVGEWVVKVLEGQVSAVPAGPSQWSLIGIIYRHGA